MKAFFLLVMLFLLFLFFASSSLAGVNLTNNGSASASAVQGSSVVAAAPVLAIQDNTANQQIPVTGACSDPYTVQNGDTLSQIATSCDTTVAAIRLSNPTITNANLIYPGESLRIPNGNTQNNTVQQPTPVPVTGSSNNGQNQSQVVVTSPNQPAVTARQSVIQTGSSLQVRAINYPPNTPVSIAIGPKSTGYNVIAAGITDATGTVVSNITVPAAPDSSTPWVVVVITAGQPVVQGMSKPFYIVPAQ